MKLSNFTLAILLIFISVWTSSCSKDPIDSSDPNDLPVGTITATIDGVKFNSKTGLASISEIIGFTDALTIIGSQGTNNPLGNSIFLFAYNKSNQPLKTITYTGDLSNCFVDEETCVYMAYFTNAGENTYATDEIFKISFSYLDYRPGGYAIGTFSGQLVKEDTEDVLLVENGKFNIKILE